MIKASIFFLLLALFGCGSLEKRKGKGLSYSLAKLAKVGIHSTEDIRRIYGEPDELVRFNENVIGIKQAVQWVYKFKGFNRLVILFVQNKVETISWNVVSGEPESKIESLLSKFSGNWIITKEAVSNPHSMPQKCYLKDLKKGFSIELNGYTKIVKSISRWNPAPGPELELNIGNGVYCVAGHCSKVTKPEAWKHNHCEWLEELVQNAKKQATGI